MEAGTKADQELERVERQIKQLESIAGGNNDAQKHLRELRDRVEGLRRQVSANYDAWQRTELARHPQRPYMLDYVQHMFTDFSEIHGDRAFGDDAAMICGMARFHGEEVLVLGTQKGRDTKQKIYRNFGMPNPEGYRKTVRAMKIAEKFGRPIFSFIDTPGAYPGLGAEERGQGEAIAHNLREMSRLKVPILVTVTGEGGSGGALAIAVGDRVFMLENSVYSVISPEGCASIMWRDASKRNLAAQAMHITAPDLIGFGIVDAIVPEPEGGAHANHARMAENLDKVLVANLAELKKLSTSELLDGRYEKFRNMAKFFRQE
ncbi:MAG TPA: acetyl-CoA carboxylase carboxyltransferase subunit alpha [Candidatus Saccharimonadales bacterium]|nr:acetyl-CoA carboxylase carboxyltransferase subunit alpha [Candidatus Saccharimonadales bacterium]